jgi:hypothetical protein
MKVYLNTSEVFFDTSFHHDFSLAAFDPSGSLLLWSVYPSVDLLDFVYIVAVDPSV